ncbi:hypothetical protein CNMCM5793_006809 [Aspergillus hiratsukae]|uniref:Mitochondrial intermediate peptidase n=1 Tax=Aspergillus hiratsukae TaxID=1194566 RepID=A0A8H6UCY6_9EURO|nr:hypothetical protein CNMCM5793_006809 [Aspergillus hiratsukae]
MRGLFVGLLGSLVFCAPSVSAGLKKPFRFCQLGDIQIGFGLDGWQNDTYRMGLAAQQVNAEDFDFCIAVGDLTNDRYDYEVQAFQNTFPQFKKPVHLLPGNHDISNVATLKQFTLDYNVSDHSSFSHHGYRFILLDSITLMSNLTEFESYTTAEWAWFETQLEAASHANEEIIVAHHHLPFEFTEDEADSYWTFPNRVRGKYLDLIKKYNVHHILVGHRHETKNIYASDKSFTIYVVAGTARFFDDNGFGINYFDVNGDDSAKDVAQEYVHLKGVTHMKRKRKANITDIYMATDVGYDEADQDRWARFTNRMYRGGLNSFAFSGYDPSKLYPSELTHIAVDSINEIQTAAKQLLDKLTPQDATFENVVLSMAEIDNDIKIKVQFLAFFQAVSPSWSYVKNRRSLWKEEEHLEGLGAERIQALPLHPLDGIRGVPLKKTYVNAALSSGVRSETRKEVFLQSQRIFPENIELFKEIVILRDERARLLGFKSYAHQQARSKLLKSPQDVKTMLDELSMHLLPIAQKELEALQRTKDPSVSPFYLWDFDYHHDKMLRDNYQVDHDLIAEYFPAKATIQRMLTVFETIFSLKIESLKCIRGDHVWHPEVKVFSVVDRDSSAFLGFLYLDIYPRDGKFNHAANFNIFPCTPWTGILEAAYLKSGRMGLAANLPRAPKVDNGIPLGHLVSPALDVSRNTSRIMWSGRWYPRNEGHVTAVGFDGGLCSMICIGSGQILQTFCYGTDLLHSYRTQLIPVHVVGPQMLKVTLRPFQPVSGDQQVTIELQVPQRAVDPILLNPAGRASIAWLIWPVPVTLKTRAPGSRCPPSAAAEPSEAGLTGWLGKRMPAAECWPRQSPSPGTWRGLSKKRRFWTTENSPEP